jgi:cobalt/nickel transport system permease protein
LRELYTHTQSFIHLLDARVKLIFALAFVLFLNLTPFRAWPAYILFMTIVLAVALLSRLGIGFVIKRAFLAVPFILAAAPLIFTGPSPMITLPVLQRFQIVYSLEGFERFISIAIKTWISVQAAILLASTTHFTDILFASQQLKVPKLFVAIIGLMWRYLYVISDEVTRMLRARASRSVSALSTHHPGGSLFWRARVTGGMAGSLFLRSIERSDRVYAAMLSRGYNGKLPETDTAALSKNDRLILVLGLVLLMFLSVLGVLTGG